MIVRAWRGRAASSDPDGYPAHFRRSVLPELQHIAGFLGASLLRESRPDGIEFLVLTRWQSMEAIRTFAGTEVGRAVVEAGAVAALIDFDRTVTHYEVVEEVGAS
jgi:heme-degrading monooxygenase HmoA